MANNNQSKSNQTGFSSKDENRLQQNPGQFDKEKKENNQKLNKKLETEHKHK